MRSDNQFEKYKELLKDNNPGACQACSGVLSLEQVNLEDYQGGKLYLMENVPAYVCQECGEVWVPEPIMFEFEKMISTAKEHHHKKRPSTKLTKAKTKKKTSKNKKAVLKTARRRKKKK